MKLNALIMLIFAVSIVGMGCKPIKRSEVPPPILNPSIETVDDSADEVRGVSADLGEIAQSIGVATDSIEKKDDRRAMVPEVKQLRAEVPKIEGERKELDAVSSRLTATSQALQEARERVALLQEARDQDAATIEGLNAEISDRDGKIEELESEASKQSKKLLTLASLVGVVCIAVCAMLMFNGKGGIGLGIFGIALIIASTAASWVMSHAWIGGVGVLFAVGLVIFKIVELHRSKKANGELVATTEKLKKYLPEEDRKREFGDMVGNGEVGSIQSPTTQEIVAREREKLRGRVRQFVPIEPRTTVKAE